MSLSWSSVLCRSLFQQVSSINRNGVSRVSGHHSQMWLAVRESVGAAPLVTQLRDLPEFLTQLRECDNYYTPPHKELSRVSVTCKTTIICKMWNCEPSCMENTFLQLITFTSPWASYYAVFLVFKDKYLFSLCILHHLLAWDVTSVHEAASKNAPDLLQISDYNFVQVVPCKTLNVILEPVSWAFWICPLKLRCKINISLLNVTGN